MKLNHRIIPILQFALFTGMLITIVPDFADTQVSEAKSLLQRSRDQRSREVSWEKVAEFNFDNPSELARFPVPEGKWEISDGKLRAIGGDRNRAILLAKNVGDPVRIEFEATNTADSEGFYGDITVLLNTMDSKSFFEDGYALTTASFGNSCTTFYREGKSIAGTEYTPVVSGVKNHVVLEFKEGHIRYWLNDTIILEAWDQAPLEMEDGNWIGIRTWATNMVLDNVVVFKGK